MALTALGGLSAAAQTIELPSGIWQVVLLLVGGAGLRWYFRQEQKRLMSTLAQSQAADAEEKEASAREIYQRIEKQLAQDTDVKIQKLRTELAEANTAIAAKDARLLAQNEKIRVLSTRIERLSDQILALENGESPRKRRGDPSV